MFQQFNTHCNGLTSRHWNRTGPVLLHWDEHLFCRQYTHFCLAVDEKRQSLRQKLMYVMHEWYEISAQNLSTNEPMVCQNSDMCVALLCSIFVRCTKVYAYWLQIMSEAWGFSLICLLLIYAHSTEKFVPVLAIMWVEFPLSVKKLCLSVEQETSKSFFSSWNCIMLVRTLWTMLDWRFDWRRCRYFFYLAVLTAHTSAQWRSAGRRVHLTVS